MLDAQNLRIRKHGISLPIQELFALFYLSSSRLLQVTRDNSSFRNEVIKPKEYL